MIRIELAWPARPLWANWRGKLRDKISAPKAARHAAWATALSAGIKQAGITRPILRFQFHPPTKRLPDLQNMPHTVKAQIDGIADALGIDDKHFLCVWPMQFAEPVKGGKVVVTIDNVETVPLIGTIT
jgi:crossover junction endodeoxyribonuclease RusA